MKDGELWSLAILVGEEAERMVGRRVDVFVVVFDLEGEEGAQAGCGTNTGFDTSRSAEALRMMANAMTDGRITHGTLKH